MAEVALADVVLTDAVLADRLIDAVHRCCATDVVLTDAVLRCWPDAALADVVQMLCLSNGILERESSP
jgi:hypothetical protein